ncbi:hypothetical protein C1645_874611 [Glomus cerebriforme]|uniref:BTB/POZ domain-containing protein n=1 Tax=Glomus cerebriforme TaxID=658196 RepID=A0A397TCG7_9GLOM|nr:hypothetical protein C1645_874611 [Glomus cerebriforme]
MTDNFPNELLNDLEKLFSSGKNYDVIIKAGKCGNLKTFYTHSLILSSRSTYFKAALSKYWARKKNGKIIFKKPNIDPKIMELILRYIYIGVIDLDKWKGIEILKYFVASDELNLKNLCDYIEGYIIEKQANFFNENPNEVLQTIFHYESLTSLKDFYLKLICDNPEVLFESRTFLTIDKSILILLIQRDDLNMKEYEIWSYVLKWGIAQMSEINDLSNWAKEDLIELEEILHDLIPLIRWVQIPPKIFHQNISPFKKIFPENIYDDIIGYYLNPDSPPRSLLLSQPRNPSFKIINKKHFSIISSWIDNQKEYYNIKNIPYSFELLYSATRDGFDSEKFHELCDDKGPTLIVAKIKDTGKLIGGYNIKSWKFQAISNNNFLFSFSNQNDFDSPIIARCASATNLIDSNIIHDPGFINLSGLVIKDDTIECTSINSFPEIKSFVNIGQKFSIEDCEVIKITKLSEFISDIDSLVITLYQKYKIDKIYSIVKSILQGSARILIIIFQNERINSIVKYILQGRDKILVNIFEKGRINSIT